MLIAVINNKKGGIMAETYRVELSNGESYNVTTTKLHHEEGFLDHVAGKIRNTISDETLKTFSYAGGVVASIVSITINGISVYGKQAAKEAIKKAV